MNEPEKAVELFKQAIEIGETLSANSSGDAKIKTDLTIAYERSGVAYEKMSVQSGNAELHRKGCQEFQKSLKTWEEIGHVRKLLRWEEAAVTRVKQNLEKCN